MTKKILIGVGVVFVLFIILIIATGGSNEETYLPPSIQSADTSDLQPQEENVKISPENIATGNQATELVKAQITNYKLPTPSGKWQTCVLSRVNSLDNVQLLSFYEWVQSLSPYASEQSRTIGIARKLGCPEPIVKTIPAKTITLYSRKGIGSQALGEVAIDNAIPKAEWHLSIVWSGSPFNETFGAGGGIDGEEIAFRKASWEYGIVDYEESATMTGTPLVIGFNIPSGSNYESGEQLTGGNIIHPNRFEFLRIKAPSQVSWEVIIDRIVEPARTIIE